MNLKLRGMVAQDPHPLLAQDYEHQAGDTSLEPPTRQADTSSLQQSDPRGTKAGGAIVKHKSNSPEANEAQGEKPNPLAKHPTQGDVASRRHTSPQRQDYPAPRKVNPNNYPSGRHQLIATRRTQKYKLKEGTVQSCLEGKLNFKIADSLISLSIKKGSSPRQIIIQKQSVRASRGQPTAP
ncbi:hypothetical protein CRENBAI_024683 [Crenichthys baileyi]|uniref:Uncharacterized protein n=1 Tax=Crenichthys baileyi TaxID=28760 RepID=A0AAV9RPJ3_9TELE